MNYLNQEIEGKLKEAGADFVRFLDVSKLSHGQNRGFPHAILIGLAIDPGYLKGISSRPDYVPTHEDGYVRTENRAGELADELAGILIRQGYNAFSQSDAELLAEGRFDFARKESVLPHKTVAGLSGSGWIGKNNLFITPEYGAAQCLGTVLTDAPLETVRHEPLPPKCGNCSICMKVCGQKVLKGRMWSSDIPRDEIVDVRGCTACLKCLVHCPWTHRYLRQDVG